MESTNLNTEFNLCLETLLSSGNINHCLVDLGWYLKAKSVMRDSSDGQGKYNCTLGFNDCEMKGPMRVGVEWGKIRVAAKVRSLMCEQ